MGTISVLQLSRMVRKIPYIEQRFHFNVNKQANLRWLRSFGRLRSTAYNFYAGQREPLRRITPYCRCTHGIIFVQRSYIWTRVCKFLWPFVIIVSAVRAILMIVELERGCVPFLFRVSSFPPSRSALPTSSFSMNALAPISYTALRCTRQPPCAPSHMSSAPVPNRLAPR